MGVKDIQPPIGVVSPNPTDVGTDGRILIPGVGGGGGGGDKYLPFPQGVAASTWTINHNLGKKPSVTVYDDAIPPREWEGDVTYVDDNNLTISFTVAGVPASFGGIAYLN